MTEEEKLRMAIRGTLELADRLVEIALMGGGFVEHWGERVLQAVEPLRDVNKFCDDTLHHNRILLEANSEFIAQRDEALDVLEFYADPETYFGIGFFPDPPTGEFMEDFEETDLGMKPGKRAREVLEKLSGLPPQVDPAGSS